MTRIKNVLNFDFSNQNLTIVYEADNLKSALLLWGRYIKEWFAAKTTKMPKKFNKKILERCFFLTTKDLFLSFYLALLEKNSLIDVVLKTLKECQERVNSTNGLYL